MAILKVAALVLSFLCATRSTLAFILDDDCFVSPPCLCMPDGVDCTNMGLDTLPLFDSVDWNSTFFFLQLDNNNLTAIDDGAFTNINVDSSTNTNLYLQSNSITSLSSLSFTGIEHSVNIINLTDNQLIDLPAVFANLTKLRHLYLNKNPLTSLNALTMSELGRHLNTLEIDMSHFVSWPSELHFLRYLLNLVLYNVPFDNLQYDALQGFENILTSFSIIGSKLRELPISICHLTRLNKLVFENNHNLIDKRLHAESCHRDSLSVSKHMVMRFRNNTLVIFPNVLKAGSFYDIIDVGHNKLQVIQQGMIPKCTITYLYLNHNNFNRIPTALNNLNSLSVLDLSFNSIMSIEENDMPNIFPQQIYLRNNRIQYIASEAFRNKNIDLIDLSNNNLKTIPESLKYIQSTGTIHLEGNKIDCMCVDFDADSWNTTSMTISGKCDTSSESLQMYLSSVPATCS